MNCNKNRGQNSTVTLAVDGKGLSPGSNVRQRLIHDTDGSWTLKVWFKRESEEPMEFAYKKIP